MNSRSIFSCSIPLYNASTYLCCLQKSSLHIKTQVFFPGTFVWLLLKSLLQILKMQKKKNWHQTCTNLQYIPINEKHVIFGANWLRVEWNPSRQLVWDSGEACLIPLTREALVKAEYIFSYTGESIRVNTCLYAMPNQCDTRIVILFSTDPQCEWDYNLANKPGKLRKIEDFSPLPCPRFPRPS